MKWPEDLIIGGVQRNEHMVSSASAFQSVFLVAGPSDVYYRFKHTKSGVKPNLDQSSFTIGKAGEIIQAWQRNFTLNIYQHPSNLRGKQRAFHPLASTSISDMLEEFSKFNFTVIIIGYVLMASFYVFDCNSVLDLLRRYVSISLGWLVVLFKGLLWSCYRWCSSYYLFFGRWSWPFFPDGNSLQRCHHSNCAIHITWIGNWWHVPHSS